MGIRLNRGQFHASKLIEEGHNVLVTGQAGTGKTYLIKCISKSLSDSGKCVVVTATTGVAAQHFQNGKVIHSWAGILDGRYTNHELLTRLKLDEQQHIVNAIKKTDVLIIDEISMLSLKTFEQVEFVCRTLRSSSLYFGGLQCICVGDFFQLPPVANDLYHDPGTPVFNSEIFRTSIPHKVNLTEVIRQSEPDLVRAINELEMGCPSESTNFFLYSLERLIPEAPHKDKMYLYGTNFEVDCHNSEQLQKLPGDEYTYSASDSGDIKLLNKLGARRILKLKINCPVVLTRNLSSCLANGMMGTVIKLDVDGPTVKFGDLAIKLSRCSFSAYSPDSCRIIAERHQFPIAVAFAMTVHKAQGSTMQNVVIDCRNMFQPGQIGVAVGRAVESSGLQILNYRPSSCRRRHDIDNFMKQPGKHVRVDVTCCKETHVDCGDTFMGEVPLDSPRPESDAFSVNDEDLTALEGIQTTPVPVSLDTDLEAAGLVPQQTTGFSEEDAIGMLDSLMMSNPVTETQKELNFSIIILKRHSQKVSRFLTDNFHQISNMYEECGLHVDTVFQMKASTLFLKNFHAYAASDNFLATCQDLFSGSGEKNDLLTGKLLSLLRKKVVLLSAKKLSSESHVVTAEKMADVPNSSYGKIRHVGGRAIAKTKFKHMSTARRQFEATGKIEASGLRIKVNLLQTLTVSQAEILETSSYPNSLVDTQRKQNLRCSLTNVCDETFEFFLLLEKKRIPLYKSKADLAEKATDVLHDAHQAISNDKHLYSTWVFLFKDINTSLLGKSGKFNEYESLVSDMLDITIAIQQLYEEVTSSYLNVADAEYRKKLSEEFGKRSTMEHRKQVLIKSGKSKTTELSFQSIVKDKSDSKIASHYKLKGILLEDRMALNAFTKADNLLIAESYGVKFKTSIRKDVMIDKLAASILNSDNMPYPEKLHEHQQKTAEVLSESMQPPITGEQGLLHVSSKGKRQSKAKRQGKAKSARYSQASSRRKLLFEEVDSDFCALCGEMYFTEDTEPWIGCSNCDRWWHRKCSGISNEASWELYTREEISWNCPTCI